MFKNKIYCTKGEIVWKSPNKNQHTWNMQCHNDPVSVFPVNNINFNNFNNTNIRCKNSQSFLMYILGHSASKTHMQQLSCTHVGGFNQNF